MSLKPSQRISRADIDAAYDKLHAKNEKLKRDLADAYATNNFDAKRLRRLANLVGAATPGPSDEELLGCAGTVIGSICRQVEDLIKRAGDLQDTLKEVSGCHGAHDTPKLCEGCLLAVERALGARERLI